MQLLAWISVRRDHVQVGPVRLNYLEQGYISRDSDVLQNVVEW